MSSNTPIQRNKKEVKKGRLNSFKIPTVQKQSFTVFTSEGCVNCETLKRHLEKLGIAFSEKSVDDTDTMTDLIMKDLVVLSTPALKTPDSFFFAYEIFDSQNRLILDFEKIVRGEK